MTKKEARQIVQKKRNELSDQYKKRANQSILKQIVNLDAFKAAHTLFCYVSMKDEVDTYEIIETALKQNKKVGVPVCIGKGIMEVRQIQSFNDLQKGSYGILEPKDDCPILEKQEIELGIIPCVSADKKGNRLGHGAGFYDRYLMNTRFPKVLLCWRKLMLPEVPIDAYDVSMDLIISEKK